MYHVQNVARGDIMLMIADQSDLIDHTRIITIIVIIGVILYVNCRLS